MAKVAFRDAELFLRIARRCDEEMLARFNAQELAIVAWAFATAQVVGDDEWFSRLAKVWSFFFYCYLAPQFWTNSVFFCVQPKRPARITLAR